MKTAVTKHGETWDMLSYRIYGDEHYMDTLIGANYLLRKVAIFPHGVEINVPDIDTGKSSVSSNLPPWKRK